MPKKRLGKTLLENQKNYKLIKILLKYTKYYSVCSYIYDNNLKSDEENISNFLDEFEKVIKETTDEKEKNENMLTLLIHPYLYGISY